MKNVVKNLIKTFIIAVVVLFVGLIFIFLLMNLLPIDPVLVFLPPVYTPAEYQAIAALYHFDQPLIFQFVYFLGRFFSGRWFITSGISPGTPVISLLLEGVPRTFEVLLLPLIVGALIGILIGIYSTKTRFKWLRALFQIISLFGYALPIIFLGLMFQFIAFQTGILPTYGFKDMAYSDPPFVTGFRIWDSILVGRWDLALDTALHYILPGLILGVTISALMIKFVRINSVNKAQGTSVIYHTSRIALFFGLIFGFALLIDLIFGLNGFGSLFFIAIFSSDYFLIQGCLFVVIIIIILVTLVFNILYGVYHLFVEKKIWPTTWIRKEVITQEEVLNTQNQEKSYSNFKRYLKSKLKSPIFWICIPVGLVLVILHLIITIAPQLFTQYTLAEALGVYAGAWDPPSPGHPLGQGQFGRDILALTMYGIQESLIFGILTTLIGIGGGLLFGFLANKRFYEKKFIKWFLRWPILGFMFLFYLIPLIMLVPIIEGIFGPIYLFLMLTIGIFLIPLCTWIFVKTDYRIFDIIKKLIIYIPLFLGFAIVLYNTFGFLNFYVSSANYQQLGYTINQGRSFLYSAPWATLWPGLAILLLTLGFFLIHEGFQDHSKR